MDFQWVCWLALWENSLVDYLEKMMVEELVQVLLALVCPLYLSGTVKLAFASVKVRSVKWLVKQLSLIHI